MSGEDLVRHLRELAELHAAGAVTADEFATAKADLLGGVDRPARVEPVALAKPAPELPTSPATPPPNTPAGGTRFCPVCGRPVDDHSASFCGSCGGALRGDGSSTGGSAWATGSVAPGAGSPVGGPELRKRASEAASTVQARAQRHGLTVERLGQGDWRGAVAAALSSVGAVIALMVVCLVLVGTTGGLDSAGGRLPVVLVAVGTALAFGGSVSIGGAAFGVEADAASSVMPLGATILGFGVIGFVFLRRLRASGVDRPVDVALQGVRTWLVFLGALFLVALVGRFSPGGAFGDGSSPVQFGVTTGIAATLFWGSVFLGVTLLAAVAVRMPGTLPPRLRGWRDGAAPVAAGVVTTVMAFAVLAVIALLVGLVVLVVRSGGPSGGTVVGILVAILLLLPNLVLMALVLAVGVPVDASYPGSVLLGTDGSGSSPSVVDLIAAHPLFLLLPLAAALALVAGGVVTALHAPTPAAARRSGWQLGAGMALAFAFVVIITSISVQAGFAGVYSTSGVGVGFFTALFLGALWGAAAGWIGATLAPALPISVQQLARARTGRDTGRPEPVPMGHADESPTVPERAGERGATDGAQPDLVSRLRELAELHASGRISDDHFARAKADLLGDG